MAKGRPSSGGCRFSGLCAGALPARGRAGETPPIPALPADEGGLRRRPGSGASGSQASGGRTPPRRRRGRALRLLCRGADAMRSGTGCGAGWPSRPDSAAGASGGPHPECRGRVGANSVHLSPACGGNSPGQRAAARSAAGFQRSGVPSPELGRLPLSVDCRRMHRMSDTGGRRHRRTASGTFTV